mmetsp:Transcript_83506/g.231664  ORF Transcript_83506/g.231664 Transcript_83506/m.231664 type:complete len:198 (+) Transcript_83506:93-686(+)
MAGTSKRSRTQEELKSGPLLHSHYKHWDSEAARIAGLAAPRPSPSDIVEQIWKLNAARMRQYIEAHGASRHGGEVQAGQLWAGGDDDLFFGRGKGKRLKPDFADVLKARCEGCGLVEWAMSPENLVVRDELIRALTESRACAKEAMQMFNGADTWDNHMIRTEGYGAILRLLQTTTAAVAEPELGSSEVGTQSGAPR